MSLEHSAARQGVARQAFTIDEFCEAHGIAKSMFYKMQRDGCGPEIMMVGSQSRISVEAAAKWRRAREKAARSDEAVAARREDAARRAARAREGKRKTAARTDAPTPA